jgi:hypothetical protein
MLVFQYLKEKRFFKIARTECMNKAAKNNLFDIRRYPKRIVTFILLSALHFSASAQEAEPLRSIVGIHVGPAFVGSLYLADDNWEPEVQQKLVTQLTFDYMLRKGFSVGATVAYQSINLSLIDTLNSTAIEEGKIDRIYVGGRTLWHYGNNEKWDLYSGIKLGLEIFSPSGIKKNHNEKSIISSKHTRSAPGIGIIPIGCRYHLSENLTIGAQFSVWVPTQATFNFNYAF